MKESEKEVKEILALQELRRNLAKTLCWKYGPDLVLADTSDVLPFADVRLYTKPIDYLRHRCKTRPQTVLNLFPGSLKEKTELDNPLIANFMP